MALTLALVALSPAAAVEKIDIASVDLESLLDLSVEAVALHEERASEAAASVFVITREEIHRQGFRTLEEAVRTVPGLFGYADGLYPMVGVRGMGLLGDYTTRLLVLVDGHPLNNSVALGQSYLGRDLPVPLAAVRRIEVIKGPVGSLYGPTAFLGVVNLVTGSAPGLEGSARGEVAQGALRTGEADLMGAGAGAGFSWLASAGAHATRGQDQRYPEYAGSDPGGGLVKGMDAAAALQGYASLAWREFTASGACGQFDRGLSSAPYSSLLRDDRNRLENRSCFAQLGITHPFSQELTLQARASYDDDVYRDAYAYAPPASPNGLFRDRASDRWLSAELRATWKPWPGTHLVGGAEGESHDTLQRTWPDQASGVSPVRIGRTYRTLNAYLLAEQPVGAGLMLHGGLTFYAHEIFGSRLTPKLAAVWKPGRSDTLKLVYSEGFRTPTASEALFEDGTTYQANPALRPETVRSLELAWERRLARVLALSASLFESRYHDLIGFVSVLRPGAPLPALPSDYREQARNLEALRVRGGELGLRLTWHEWLQGWAGLSIQSVDQANRPNFPGLTATFALSTRAPWRPLTLSLNGSVTSSRATDLGAMGGNGPRSVPVSMLLNASGLLDVPGVPGLTLEFGVQNLLDARGLDPVPGDFAPVTTLAQQVRTLRAGARFRY